MADTTTPVTPPAQDLQINLEDATKAVETVAPENKPADLDLNLDINLPEAPKTDERLKAEDQKNAAPIETPVAEIPAVVTPIVDTKPEEISAPTPVEPTESHPEKGGNEGGFEAQAPVTPQTIEQKTEIQPAPGVLLPETEVVEQADHPSTVIETETITAAAPAELKEDMKIIDALEGHASAGGLAPEATVVPQPAPVEMPKTFDLDAMLGTPTGNSLDRGRNEEGVVAQAKQPETPIEQKTVMPVAATVAPVMQPAFTIPTTTTQMPVSAMPNISPSSAIVGNNLLQSSVKKTTGVKALMFVVLFMALGFMTFFILKTMYPVEFSNMFGGGQAQMHASEAITDVTGAELTGLELTGTEIIETEITGTTEEITDTGTTMDSSFGELNDLATEPITPEQTDLSRLTDYATQGNNFLEQGKSMNNNTVIKYGLYISKKATSFLEDIANGKEINNLSGYFAQFDQYIAQLKILVGQVPNPEKTVTTPETPFTSEASPLTPPANEQPQEVTTPESTPPAPTAVSE